MKTHQNSLRLSALLLMLTVPIIAFSQNGLLGLWKYAFPGGETTMQINATTILINGQSFEYKAQGNVLMINEGTQNTPYPYMLDGNQLTLEFPDGSEFVFTRSAADSPSQSQLPMSMSKPSGSMDQGQQSSTLSGKWLFQNQQGQLVLEFLSANQLSFNGETTQYQLKEGVIQAMGDYGWIDYPYTLSQGTLTITFPDGSQFPFTRTSSTATNQQGMSQQKGGGESTWQLNGVLCSWSGSSNDYSSYSRTRKLVFDGKGNYQFGSESSFSSGDGLAYGGNPNVETGTYSVGENIVTLYSQSGETSQFKINMRQDSGMITELMYEETIYATSLCE
jgi:frataxin-like iron-binding protein CyaY